MRQILSFGSIKGFKRSSTAKIIVSALLFSALQVVAVSVSPTANAATGQLAMTELTLPAGIKAVNGIATSSDGTKLVFISGTRAGKGSDSAIYTSSDSGITWVSRKSDFNSSEEVPTQIAGSDDGKYLVVTTLFNNIYISGDYGTTWSKRIIAGAIFCNVYCAQQSIAMSADGRFVALTKPDSTTWYLSTDYGSTWPTKTAPSSVSAWQSMHMSGDGISIWISQWGNTQTLWKYNRTNDSYSSSYFPGIDVGPGITGSADGTIVYSAGGNYFADGFVFKSTDSGATFSRIGPNKTFVEQPATSTRKTWTKFKASADGTKLIGVDKSNQVFISLDSGVTWARQVDGVSLGYNDNVKVVTSTIFTGDGSTAFVTAGPDDGPGAGPVSWGVGRIYKYSLPKISTTTLTTLNASRTYGASNTLTATISPNTATGTVNFQSGGVSISGCSSTTVTSGVATCTTWKPGVGTYANITAVYSGDGSLTGSTTATAISFSVTAAPLSITASSSTLIYGATIPAITASYSGLVNSDVSAVVTGQSCSTTYTTTTSVGSTSLTSCSGGSATNYTISYISGVITTFKATPTFSSFGNVSKTYGATAFNLTDPTPSTPGTWTYDSGTPSVISLTGISATVAAYGTSVITATFIPDDAANYVSGGTTAMTVTVSKATLGITASSHTVAFGDAIPTITPTYSGFVNGEDSNVLLTAPSCSTIYTTTTSVGKAGSSCSGAAASNYSFAYTAGEITISQGGQTSALTINSTSVTYGSTLSLTTLGGNGSGANSFTVNSGSCTVSSSTLTPTAAGICMVTATKAANGDYLALSSVSTAITIAKKNLTISGLTGVNKVFDGDLASTVTGTPSLVGVVGVDNVALTGTPTFAFATADVANTKALTGSGYGLTNSTASNYTLTQPVVIANVTQKAARVIATNVTIASGATVTSSFTTSGLVMGDSVTAVTYSYSGTGTTSAPTAVGVYIVTPSLAVFGTGTFDNYSITYDQATLTILAKYNTTYNANGGEVLGGSASSVDFVVGETALTLPAPTRANYTFTGWHTLQTNGTQVTGAYTPTATATLWAHWVQNSLYGMGNNTRIFSLTTIADVGNTYSANAAGGTVGIEYLANALPAGTIIDAYLLSDTSTATTLFGASNTYVMSLVLAWVATNGTVPTTATGKAISMTITNSAIKKGAKIYSVIGTSTTLLGVAAVDGSAAISITDDPQIIIAITKPDAPTSVTATNGGNTVSIVSWTPPANDGGSAVTSYNAVSNAGQSCTTATSSCQVAGLTNGTSYTFTVTALNSIGVSDTSTASIAVTPIAPASAPIVTPSVVVTPVVVSAPVVMITPTLTSLTFVENATKNGGKLVWIGTNVESVLYTGNADAYPAPYNYGAFTISWGGQLANMVPGVTYTMKLEVRSSTGGSASKTIEYTIAKPVVDTSAADASLKAAQEKAAAEKKAAEEAAAAALKIAQERALAEAKAAADAAALKITQEKAAAEAKAAADAAALKIAQEKAAAEKKAAEAAAAATALKVAQEKAAAEAKAVEEAAALKISQEKVAADAAALVIAKKTPVLNLFSSYSTAKYKSTQMAKMKKLTLKLEPATTLKCVGYFNAKGTTATKAKATALAQAKATCANAKKLNPSITTVVTTAAVSKAPKPLVGASNTKAKYRVDLFAYKG